MDKKYTALRIIGTLYKIAGILMAIGTVILVIAEFATINRQNQALRLLPSIGFEPTILAVLMAVVTILVGVLSALGVYAIGEALYLLIGLEENTRYTAILMRDRFYPQAPQPARPQVAPPTGQPTYPPTV